jgi:hypothetical protein
MSERIEVYASGSESDEPLRAEMYTVTRNPAYDDQMQRLQEECNALRDRVSELERELGEARARATLIRTPPEHLHEG